MISDLVIFLHSKVRSVRIFNLLIIFFIPILYGQNKFVKINSLDNDLIKDTLGTLIDLNSNIALEYHLDSFSVDENWIQYQAINNYKTIDTIFIKSTIDIRSTILNQIIRPYKNIPIDNGFSELGNTLNEKYYFFNDIPEYTLGLIDQNKLGAIIFLNPKFESHFSGIFGIGKSGEKWDFTGEIDLHLENLFLTAGYFDIYWKRMDSLSQVIKFQINEPHPFGWNIGIQLDYHHEVVNGLYTINRKKGMFKFFSHWFNRVNLGYSSGEIYPTSIGDDLGYKKINFKTLNIESIKDSRNDRFFPTEGIYYKFSFNSGIQKESEFFEGSLNYSSFLPINSNINLHFKSLTKGIYDFKNIIPKSRYYYFGGTSTLRGYNEQQFKSTQFQIFTFEGVFSSNPYFRTKGFLDHAITGIGDDFNQYTGIGFGISQKTKQAVVELQYALPLGDSVNNGSLHIKWLSRL